MKNGFVLISILLTLIILAGCSQGVTAKIGVIQEKYVELPKKGFVSVEIMKEPSYKNQVGKNLAFLIDNELYEVSNENWTKFKVGDKVEIKQMGGIYNNEYRNYYVVDDNENKLIIKEKTRTFDAAHSIMSLSTEKGE